jgi:T3SS negative regulator,GrlR
MLMSPPNGSIGDALVNATGPDKLSGAGPESVANGLHTLGIEMSGATGIVVLHDGRIMGGDSFFYYTGSYSYGRGKWRGEMIVNQHTDAPGLNLVFGGREVTCGFTGTYSAGFADIDGTRWSADTAFPFVLG